MLCCDYLHGIPYNYFSMYFLFRIITWELPVVFRKIKITLLIKCCIFFPKLNRLAPDVNIDILRRNFPDMYFMLDLYVLPLALSSAMFEYMYTCMNLLSDYAIAFPFLPKWKVTLLPRISHNKQERYFSLLF